MIPSTERTAEVKMGTALPIRGDLRPEELRALARNVKTGQTALRMLALAHALDGLGRAEAARLAGMDRQALRDTVVRYNAEGSPAFTTVRLLVARPGLACRN